MKISEEEVLAEAVIELLRVRDFLCRQLDYANGNMSSKEFHKVMNTFYDKKPYENVERRLEVLIEWLGLWRVDVDVVETVLRCKTSEACDLLEKVTKQITQRLNK